MRKQNRERKRTILVMLENVNEMFTKQMRDRTDVGAMRKFFMDDNGCQLIATAPMHFDAITSVNEPFFDFFDAQVLDLLDKEESIELIRRNLEWEQRTELLKDFATLRPKLMALHDMTGGSPRLTLMLYELIVHDSVVEVRQQLMQLLDRVTPFYQDRLRDIAPLERALLETIALMRDSNQPKTPANIAARMRISQQQTSSLLKRMTESRYLKSEQHPSDKRSRLYSIREGFFDIWLAMNLSRKDRHRLPVLVECLAKFYPQWEEREQKRREYREKWGNVNSRAGLDLLSEIGSVEEQTQSKLDLAQRHGMSGDAKTRAGYFQELRSLPLDSMGQWIVRTAETSEVTTNYLDEIQEMVECWTLHRSGDLEGFMARLSDLGEQLTFRTFSEARVGFLREHLALVSDPGERIRLRSRIGSVLHDMARWSDAEVEKRAALMEAETLAEMELVSQSLNNLAGLLMHTNRLAEAEPLMRRALAIDEQYYGADHPNVAIRLNNLGQLLQDTNRLAEAEPLMRRSLAIDEQSYGAEHPKVANRLNNLAQLLRATNRLPEAEPLMDRVATIFKNSLGEGHPNVATALNNLAQLLQATNRLAEAEPLMRRALAIDEQSYGAEHPNVALRVNNLAGLLMNTNRLAEAEPLMRRALAINEQSYGVEHPSVACGLNNLAMLLRATNRLPEAEPLMRRARAIDVTFKRLTGYEHPNCEGRRVAYVELLETMGRSENEVAVALQAVTGG